MKCYKVTKEDNRSIVSEDDAAVHYLIGENVTAPKYLAEQGYHLTAFQTRKDAKEASKFLFWWEDKNVIIWEASGTAEIKELPLIATRNSVDNKKLFIRVVESKSHWPENTLMFKELKLLKTVERLS